MLIVSFVESSGHEELGEVVDDLHPTEDGEAGEEPHGASDETKRGLKSHFLIFQYFVISFSVKVNPHKLQGVVLNCLF